MRLIDADELKKDIVENSIPLEEVWAIEVECAKALIDNAPTVSNYGEGWEDGYNHAIDLIFKELNYLVKSHVLEELRKTVSLKR